MTGYFLKRIRVGLGNWGPVPGPRTRHPHMLFLAMMYLFNHVQSPGPPMGATSLPAAIPQAFPPIGKAVQEANMMRTFIKMIRNRF